MTRRRRGWRIFTFMIAVLGDAREVEFWLSSGPSEYGIF